MALITRRYEDIVDFTSKINRSVIVLKKKSLLSEHGNKEKYPTLEVNEDELVIARDNLLKSLGELEKLTSENISDKKLLGFSENSTLQSLIVKNETDKKEIETIIHSLQVNEQLSKINFLILDKIIAILDSERNLLFRKLRTARG